MQTRGPLRLQVAALGVPYVLMHMRGDPATMQTDAHTSYSDVVAEVGVELQRAAESAVAAGVASWQILLDPGAALTVMPAPHNCCKLTLI